MAKFYKTIDFKNLERTWNRKLYEAGFIDAEKTPTGRFRTVLKQSSGSSYRQEAHARREAKLEYYRSLCHGACNTHFPKPVDKYVMTRKSEGVTIRQIVIELAEQGTSIHRMTVSFIIRRWEHEWGIKYWSAKQRNLKNG